jgi:cobalt/nickel transport system ATP-binding protein
MPEEYALEAKRVCFRYPDGTHALDQVDFHACAGEFVAMLASNGSGKTTLLKVLLGVLNPQEGQVIVDGKALTSVSKTELYQRVGLVLQNPVDQLFAPTVDEDVAYGPRNLGLSEEEVERRIAASLDMVDASNLRGRAIHHLSYGQQKRVCVAGILAMKPATLVLDEPTAGLDPAGEALMMRLLKRLNEEQGITVVLATHSVDLLPLFADRIYILRHGTVVAQGIAENIFGRQEMIDQACLRLPYVATLLQEMKQYDGVPVNGLPLTVREARARLLELIPQDLILNAAGHTNE